VGDHFRRGVAERIERYNATQRRGKLLDLANGVATSALGAVMSIVILVLCARRVIVDQSMTLGQLLTFTALSAKIFSSLSALLEENLELQEHLVILRRYFDFERPPALRAGAGDEGLRVTELAAERVTCAYQGAPVLDGASLAVRRGETVMLRGANGSGKSTLVRILAGLQDAAGGDVLVNGASRRLFDERELHERVVLVSAEDALFNDTLRFNLTLGREHGTRKLVEYAKRVRLYDAIVAHPDHFDRVIDEGGRNLSAGQRRKVLVLRAVLAGADILILDEVFRGIDDASQTAISEFLGEFTELGLLVITHETLGALRVDRLLEMRDGRVVERKRGGAEAPAALELGDQRWMNSA
jgi:subfamily B ATP-binding cassette protein HlyB/CyaB